IIRTTRTSLHAVPQRQRGDWAALGGFGYSDRSASTSQPPSATAHGQLPMQALPFALLAMILYLGAASWQALALTRRVPQRPALVRSIGVAALLCHGLVIATFLRDASGTWLGISASAAVTSAVIAAVLLGG